MPASKNKLRDLRSLLKKLDTETKDSGLTINEWRRRREAAEARLKELEVGEREGSLLPAEEVRDAVNGMILHARETLLRIGAELQDRLAAMTDPVACGELVDAEIRRALTQLSQYKPKQPKARGRRVARSHMPVPQA